MSLQSTLENAASGLLMMSESDYPFDYIETEATSVSDALLLSLAGKPTGTGVKETSIDHLFRNVAGSVNAATAARFQQLANTLQTSLHNLAVYRVGEVQVDVYILGINAAGKVAGMHTRLIET